MIRPHVWLASTSAVPTIREPRAVANCRPVDPSCRVNSGGAEERLVQLALLLVRHPQKQARRLRQQRARFVAQLR